MSNGLPQKDVRYYKGKYPVEVLSLGKIKGKKGADIYTAKVKALVNIPMKSKMAASNTLTFDWTYDEGHVFFTIPSLLWRNKR